MSGAPAEPVFDWAALPLVTADLPGSGGRIRVEPDDFRVLERPAYAPQGDGAHLYLRVRKAGLATRDVVRGLVDAGVPEARVGYAGQKDKHAVTEQWISLPWSHAEAADALDAVPGVQVLERVRHRNKLGLGHLHGNRFEVRLRDVPQGGARAAADVLEALARRGVPNYYGPQRFGRWGRNAVDGLRLLRGEAVPGDRRLQHFFSSALQSWLFNHVLAQRLPAGLFGTVVPGDWARKHDTGGTFLVEDPAEAARAERFEISALIPLHGRKVPPSEGVPGRMERGALEALGLAYDDLRGRRGDRRLARLPLRDAQLTETEAGDLWLSFELPKGAFATVVLREVTKTPVDAPLTPPDASAPRNAAR